MPTMNGREKSDSAEVAVKPANKTGMPAAEPVERRAGTEGNAIPQSTTRTQGRADASQARDRIRVAARRNKKEKFTALLHHVTPEALRDAFYAIAKNAAAGIDGITWRDYEAALERKLADLHDRVQSGAYRATPSRRVYIPKPDGGQRPLAVAALEDKIVQRAVADVLNAIYEEDFLGFSYGFRPGRGAHDALDALSAAIYARKVNYIVDADITKFFDSVSKEWLARSLEHRIGDKRVLRLIQKWLRAGVLEDGRIEVPERGTGQGAAISPLLANVYLLLRPRSVGRALATARSQGRHGHRTLRRRRDLRLRVGDRRPPLPGCDAWKTGGVCVDAPSGQDPSDRVRPFRSGQPRTTRLEQAGDLQVPGLHLHLRQIAQRRLPLEAQEPRRPHAGEAEGDQRRPAKAQA